MIARGKCLIGRCRNLQYSRGWCKAHYQRNWKYGDPLASAPKRVCSISSCEIRVRGEATMCGLHARNLRDHGDPLWVPPAKPATYSCPAHGSTYVAGCETCRASARIKHRAYWWTPERRCRRRRREQRAYRPAKRGRGRTADQQRKANAGNLRRNAAVDALADRGRMGWESWEDAIVVDENLSSRQAAVRLGRTVGAVHHRRHALLSGPRTKSPRSPRWTDAECHALVTLTNDGFSGPAVARLLGRTHEAVKFRKTILRKRGLWSPSTDGASA